MKPDRLLPLPMLQRWQHRPHNGRQQWAHLLAVGPPQGLLRQLVEWSLLWREAAALRFAQRGGLQPAGLWREALPAKLDSLALPPAGWRRCLWSPAQPSRRQRLCHRRCWEPMSAAASAAAAVAPVVLVYTWAQQKGQCCPRGSQRRVQQWPHHSRFLATRHSLCRTP
eukprot:CAMPEP_0172672862 /NCGR_PEP_ID=MMETSP1074-20121228/11805_1 /TAXON_ID=2916 /ORGANISM="Ceratium fusus, Strain PA161109" /LENGTH=167 /DNA_ID=CAMNT_0013490101 /DNA_START=323 /DNA_END=826 /DNA_ORIENTATION=-